MAKRAATMAIALASAVAAGSAGGCGDAETTGLGGASDDVSIASDDAGDDATLGDGSGADTNLFGDTSADGSGSDASSGNNCTPPVALALSPANATFQVTANQSFSQAYTATATYANNTTANVTGASFFTLSDPNFGSFGANVFSWSGAYGGTVTITTQHCGVTGSTALTLDLSAIFGGDAGLDAGGLNNDFNNNPPSNVKACAPTLVYPPDGILVPPNTNVIEVHFLMGGPPANNVFEISFTNKVTNVVIYTTCTGNTAAQGMPLNGGCVFELDQKQWDFIAQTNRNGDPVTVKVRAMGCDGKNVSSSNTRQMSFAQEDMVGTLYYWASMRITVNNVNYNSGGVYRYDFGKRGQAADPVLTPNSSVNSVEQNCIGCHSVSRDGKMMVFDFDDNDDDDEYGDVYTDVYDILNKTVATPILKGNANAFPPGYHTWKRTTKQFLLSDGPGNAATPNGAFERVSPAGALLGYTQAGTLRGTTPDWMSDDSTVVFAVPPNTLNAPPLTTTALQPSGYAGYWAANAGNADDLWFAGASLYSAPFDSNTNTLGSPTKIVSSSGTNSYYYPSYSPDTSLLVFNYAPEGSNFHNPEARVQVVPAGVSNATPVDLTKLNDSGNLTNSWARWSPFVQKYKGGKILWVTTSSTRDYGLRILNHSGGQQNCYPAESPIGPYFTDQGVSCTRAQIWMAAIQLDPNAVANGKDVSWPAFWLPFQDIDTNNHLAQWAENGYSGPCQNNSNCAQGQCCINGGCAACPPQPPPPPTQCTQNSNCAPGFCCVSAQCVTCPPPDAGTGDGGAAEGGDGGGDGGVCGASASSCSSCLGCGGQACVNGTCGNCSSSSQCCAPLICSPSGCCIQPPK